MALHKEEERICRQSGNLTDRAISLTNQALALPHRGRVREGLPLAEEAYQIASSHGYVAQAKQVKPIIDRLRQAASAQD